MKDIMDAHCGREFNLEGDGRSLLEQSERSKVSSLEGGCGSRGVVSRSDVFCAQQDLITDFVRMGPAVGVSVLDLL